MSTLTATSHCIALWLVPTHTSIFRVRFENTNLVSLFWTAHTFSIQILIIIVIVSAFQWFPFYFERTENTNKSSRKLLIAIIDMSHISQSKYQYFQLILMDTLCVKIIWSGLVHIIRTAKQSILLKFWMNKQIRVCGVVCRSWFMQPKLCYLKCWYNHTTTPSA